MLYGFPYYDTGSSGQALYTRYLTEYGERMDLVYEILKDTRHPSYGYFRETGATVWPERWSGVGNSRIHTCYTGIGGYFIKGFGGIRPDPEHPGMQRFLVKPALVDSLDHVKASHESLYGTIMVDWTRSGSEAVIDVVIPVNTSARIYLPGSHVDEIFEGGKPAATAQGLEFKGIEASAVAGSLVVFEAASGVYHFRATKVPEVAFPEPLDHGENLARIGRMNVSSMRIASEKNPEFEAFRANDDDAATKWIAASGGSQWLEVEWITPQRFAGVEIEGESDPVEFHQVQAWTGQTWVDLSTGGGSRIPVAHTFDPVTARKCRILFDAASEPPAISELRIIKAGLPPESN